MGGLGGQQPKNSWKFLSTKIWANEQQADHDKKANEQQADHDKKANEQQADHDKKAIESAKTVTRPSCKYLQSSKKTTKENLMIC